MGRVYFDEDAAYLRSLEEERIELVGPTAEYYSLNRGVHVDTLYNEPDNEWLYGGESQRGTNQQDKKAWNFCPGLGAAAVTLPVSVQYEEMDGRSPSVRSEGFKADYDAQLFMSKKHWDCAIEGTCMSGRSPKEGDVVYVFNTWWDVMKSGSGGNILDTPYFVGYRLELKRRTEFVPERKVDR